MEICEEIEEKSVIIMVTTVIMTRHSSMELVNKKGKGSVLIAAFDVLSWRCVHGYTELQNECGVKECRLYVQQNVQ